MNLTSFQKWHHAKINTFQITEDQSEVPQELIEVPTEEEKIPEDIPATPEMVSENEETEEEEVEEESSEDEPEEPVETGPNAKEKTAMGKFSNFLLVQSFGSISPRQRFVLKLISSCVFRRSPFEALT